MLKYITLFFVFGAGLAACTATTSPTPVIIVVTATPQANPTVQLTPPAGATTGSQLTETPGAAQTPDSSTTPDPNLVPTTVKLVKAKQDINIRKGPGTNFDIVGGVYAGQTAQVTGYKSADDAWWRVECPVTTVTVCWVSADPSLTEPTDTPNVGPTPTTSTEVNVETFTHQVADALQNKNYDALKAMMDDPFTLASFRSEGSEPSRDDVLKHFQDEWVGPASEIVVDLAGKTDQSKLLDGTPPLSMWDPKVKVVKSVYVQGLNADGKGAGLFVIAQSADGTLYLYAFLYAAAGFAS